MAKMTLKVTPAAMGVSPTMAGSKVQPWAASMAVFSKASMPVESATAIS
jgi:hypothetical protein